MSERILAEIYANRILQPPPLFREFHEPRIQSNAHPLQIAADTRPRSGLTPTKWTALDDLSGPHLPKTSTKDAADNSEENEWHAALRRVRRNGGSPATGTGP